MKGLSAAFRGGGEEEEARRRRRGRGAVVLRRSHESNPAWFYQVLK